MVRICYDAACTQEVPSGAIIEIDVVAETVTLETNNLADTGLGDTIYLNVYLAEYTQIEKTTSFLIEVTACEIVSIQTAEVPSYSYNVDQGELRIDVPVFT